MAKVETEKHYIIRPDPYDADDSEEDVDALVQAALYDKREELSSYYVDIKGSQQDEGALRLIDHEAHQQTEGNPAVLHNKVLNLLICLVCLFVLFQCSIAVLVYFDSDVLDLDTQTIIYYTVDVMIPLIGRLLNFILIALFLIRIFVVRRVFYDQKKVVFDSIVDSQFNNFLMRSLMVWVILSLDLVFKQANDLISCNSERSLLIEVVSIDYFMKFVDYAWVGITVSTMIRYGIRELIQLSK